MERAGEGSKKEEGEGVHLVLTVFASNSVHLTQENLARPGVDDIGL